MSQRKKHAIRAFLDADPRPDVAKHQVIARVTGARGNNLHDIVLPDGTATLVELPPRFRNIIWVKRDSYVIAEPLAAASEGKIWGEIVHVLFPEHVDTLQREGLWPASFKEEEKARSGSEGEDSDADDLLFENPNRPRYAGDDDDSSDDDSSDEDSSDEESDDE
ncbi:hypothetical protein AMAG_15570 [Allomyces macrogynus ATCC 38327]|uniref:S1-like domain-containing protein n=1 Tax=Allomyces macrogynus (strain ATCC 38327) TaxID=578462 RepID=A0A0L0T9A5_ALLM3|nr:hypothetical protein AMAG_15570 [Allomyces macrogynus ATCC 38327]|eukprot:KNE71332.1 hypothetical protein AMAG_15570 [Allomyces macrogynus ATCC 38327]